MAKVTKTLSDYSLQLELSRKEAETLLVVLMNVGGHDQHSPRKHIQDVLDAMKRSGVKNATGLPSHKHRGGIYFEDSSDPSLL